MGLLGHLYFGNDLYFVLRTHKFSWQYFGGAFSKVEMETKLTFHGRNYQFLEVNSTAYKLYRFSLLNVKLR